MRLKMIISISEKNNFVQCLNLISQHFLDFMCEKTAPVGELYL